jgi:pyrroloquinoline-quinone synthase
MYGLDMNKNFAIELKSELLAQDLLQHHFYQLWSAGMLSLDILKEYAVQYYQQVKNFPRCLSATHSITEDFATRKILLENLSDEENDDEKGGIINHIQLWKNFCLGLGLSDEQVEKAEIMPKTQELINTFSELSRESTEAGLGALYAQEHQYAKISESKRCGLQKFYGISNKDTVKFFSVHEKADIWHAEQLEKILNSVDDSKKSSIVEAGKKAMTALNGFLDGMVERFNLDKISCSI